MTAPRPLAALITGPIRPLTKQQQRVCDGIYRGLTYAQIADELGALENRPPLSVHTVTFYVQQINTLFRGLERLDPRSRIIIAMTERAQREAHRL
jgi:DNA-binding NarL/FixJ family response regulator